jgi:hypothetical protein
VAVQEKVNISCGESVMSGESACIICSGSGMGKVACKGWGGSGTAPDAK